MIGNPIGWLRPVLTAAREIATEIVDAWVAFVGRTLGLDLGGFRGRLATSEEKDAEDKAALEHRIRLGPPPARRFGPDPGGWDQPSIWNR